MKGKQYKNDLGTRITKPYKLGIDRRHFLFGMAAVSATLFLPTTITCTRSPIHDIHNQLTDANFAILSHVQNHLFPSSDHSPGAADIHAAEYFSWILMDTQKDPEVIQSLRDGLKWTDEQAQLLFEKKCIDLEPDEMEMTLRTLATFNYGELWLSRVLTYIFEALFSDPIYGSNNEEMGWKWLDHRPGLPRPTDTNKYKA